VNPEDLCCPECGVQPGAPCLTTYGRRRAPHPERRPAQRSTKRQPVTLPDPQSVRCPSWSCRARPGEPCVTTDGRTVHPHRQRWEAAILRHAGAMNPPGWADDTSPALRRP
jgi:hypothetical protein